MEQENILMEYRFGDDIKFKIKIDILNGNNLIFCRNEIEKE